VSGESDSGKPPFGDVSLSPEIKNIGGLEVIWLLPFYNQNTQIQDKKPLIKKQHVN